jgi:TonB family protein
MDRNNTQHNTNRANLTKKPPRRKSADLSFVKRESFGDWILNHVVSLAVVIAFIVVLGVSMLVINFSVERSLPQVLIEFVAEEMEEDIPTLEELEELQKEKERLEREIQEKLVQNVKNRQSNEAVKEEGGSESQVFDEEVREMMDKIDGTLRDNRSYGGPSTAASAAGEGGEGSGEGGGKGKGKDNNFSARCTVEYSFVDPTRTAIGQLYAPAYRAEHSGVVVVTVQIDRDGNVKSAYVSKSSGYSTLDEEALRAAKHERTKFNIDSSAPQRHQGTITYTFIAQ